MSQKKNPGPTGILKKGCASLDSKQKRPAEEDINEPGPSKIKDKIQKGTSLPGKYVHVQPAEVDYYDDNHNHACAAGDEEFRVAASNSGSSASSVINQGRRGILLRGINNSEAIERPSAIAKRGRKMASGRAIQSIQVNKIDSTGTEMFEEADDEIEKIEGLEMYHHYLRIINGE